MFLISCAGIGIPQTRYPQKLKPAEIQTLPFIVKKCQSDNRTGTYYYWEAERQNIYFFRNNLQINLIGGFGSDKHSFQKLSDIAIEPEGNLLALDSFAKLLRKFSPDGKWIADTDISFLSQPEKCCVSPDGDVYIYDAAPKEIYRISPFDRKIMYGFGRFQLESVSNLACTGEIVYVVSERNKKTLLFSVMGQFLRELPAQAVIDKYKNQYLYQNGAVQAAAEISYPLGWRETETSMFIQQNRIFVVRDEQVIQLEIIYRELAEKR